MKKRLVSTFSTALALFLALLVAGCGGETGGGGTAADWTNKEEWLKAYSAVPAEAYVLPEDPHFTTAAVHDPSVFLDEETSTYYVFGSHFAVAKSTDLVNWAQVVGDGSSENSGKLVSQQLYGQGTDWRTVLSKAVAHSGSGMPSTWAPDVEYINGRYYMYFSLTSAFGENKSFIGRVQALDVMGSYGTEEEIVKTNGPRNSAEPNAIDPELFYDKTGKLWMVYGSFFAGIYIKELDSKGLPVEDGYGKLIWKGSGDGPEGPFVFYNAETDYYYLMATEGSLTTNYNMHVARSKNPDGPYVDINGLDVSTKAGGGNKLSGNYQFAGDTTGRAAIGHNSVIKKDGKYITIQHARTQSGGTVSAGHSLDPRQLFFNEDGWPVMAPNRYAGESAGKVTEADVAGEYDVVLHSASLTQNLVSSVKYTFNADGTITGGEAKSGDGWTLKDGYYLTVTINGVSYKGVVVPQWCGYKNAPILSFTATSGSGRPLWGNGAVKS